MKHLQKAHQSVKREKQQLEQNVAELRNEIKHLQVADQSVKREKQHLKQDVTEIRNEMKHLQAADQVISKVRQQEEEIKQLKRALQIVSNTGPPIGSVQITMTNFRQHQDDEFWNSPPFYTHPHGYMMCLCVWPKGCGDGRGTHLGVTVHLMRGDFDDQLKWPFTGAITYQLVDQEGDEDHKIVVVSFNDLIPDSVTKRVTKEERNRTGQGNPKIVPLSDLHPKYLKNDCIKIRIVKVVLSQ